MQVLEVDEVNDKTMETWPMDVCHERKTIMIQNLNTFHQSQYCFISNGNNMFTLGELEYLESLVKLACKKWDESLKSINLFKPKEFQAIHRIYINKSSWNKTYIY